MYDLADPRRPVRVSTFADRGSDRTVRGTWTEKTIVKEVRTRHFRGELAVTSFQSCRKRSFQGFALYDVSNPRRPRKLGARRTEPRGSHEIWLHARGRRAYVYTAIPASELHSSPEYRARRRAATVPGKPDFRIFDVTNPRRPVEVGSWGAWRELGIHPTRGIGRKAFNLVHSVIVDEPARRAYLSYLDLGTVILDIRRPSRPRYLGRTSFLRGEEGQAHSAALAKGGRVLIETREHRSSSPALFDISDARRPRRLSVLRLRPRARASVHDPKVRGDRAFFSWYAEGVVVADISRPQRPRVVAQFVPPRARDPERRLCKGRCVRAWGVFATPDGYVLASDMISGLWVLRLRDAAR